MTPQILISDPEIKARIADVIWVAKRDVQMAELAVNAYLKSANALESPDDWGACADRIERATQLAASLGNNREPFDQVIAHIEHILDKYGGEDSLFLSAKMMELLLRQRKGDPAKYAMLANKATTRAEAEHNWHKARAYLQIEARWHAMAKDLASERNAILRLSETYCGEANDALKREHMGYSVAAHFLQSAIEALRRIGGTKERREQLHKIMLDYQAKSVSDMGTVSQTVDFTESANRAREFVKGKTLADALFSLALSSSSPKMSYLREQVQHLAKVAPLQHLLASVTLDSTGKVIARNPGMFSNNPNDAEAAIRAEMFRYAMMFQLFHTFGVIEPARAQINLEHNVRVADLVPIVSNNPLVPPGREIIFARGLQAGMIGDFLSAIHLLIPQFENSVRLLLYQNSALTSGLDSAGIQEDYDLNRMLYMPELAQVFSEDTIFDLKGLLVERFGSNLRNRMAHGLLEQGEFYSPQAVYLWWLILRLCCLPILTMKESQDASEEKN